MQPVLVIFAAFLRILRRNGYYDLHSAILPMQQARALSTLADLTAEMLPTFCADTICECARIWGWSDCWRSRVRPVPLPVDVSIRLEFEAHAMALAFAQRQQQTYIRDGKRCAIDSRTFALQTVDVPKN